MSCDAGDVLCVIGTDSLTRWWSDDSTTAGVSVVYTVVDTGLLSATAALVCDTLVVSAVCSAAVGETIWLTSVASVVDMVVDRCAGGHAAGTQSARRQHARGSRPAWHAD